jgi:PilZ domain-containing protein
MPPAESDRRDFPRLKRSVPVRYKFLSSTVREPAMDRVCDGVTQNISMGGLLLVGPVPRLEWMKDLLLGRINVGVNLLIPNLETPVKVLTRVAWIEAMDEQAISLRIGLRILEVPAEHRKILSDFLTMETAAS